MHYDGDGFVALVLVVSFLCLFMAGLLDGGFSI